MAAAKKKPERMCVVCRQMKEKNLLLRVVKTPEGEVLYDPTGKMPGRGAYICASKECFANLRKAKGFEKAFRCGIPASILDEIGAASKNSDRL